MATHPATLTWATSLDSPRLCPWAVWCPLSRLASKLVKSRFPLSPSSLGKYEPTPSPAPGRLLLHPLATWGPGLQTRARPGPVRPDTASRCPCWPRCIPPVSPTPTHTPLGLSPARSQPGLRGLGEASMTSPHFLSLVSAVQPEALPGVGWGVHQQSLALSPPPSLSHESALPPRPRWSF